VKILGNGVSSVATALIAFALIAAILGGSCGPIFWGMINQM